VSPLTRVEHVLLGWVSFLVVPLFALANAGVELSGTSLAAALGSALVWAIVVARVVGKLVGIWGGALVAARVGLVDLPSSLRSPDAAAMAAAAGAGFTVSLFVAEVSFGPRSPLLEPVKIALLLASVLSAALSVGLRSSNR